MLDITKPTLILDEKIARRNIKRMADKAKNNNVVLTPHFKTHQSLAVGRWFKEEGVKAITVSSVSMAEYFAKDGWRHITIAFPVNVLEINEITNLASRVELTLLVTDIEQVKLLLRAVDIYVNILIEIETGANRSGINPQNNEAIYAIAKLLEGTQHHFKGFYSHFGHTYSAANPEEVLAIHHQSLGLLTDLQLRCAYEHPQLSIGDTPSCSLVDDFSKVKSIHAGNFVFYDLTQEQIGSCGMQDIAIALACPVVSKIAERQEVIIYGGGVHLSKESLFDRALNTTIYGRIVRFTNDGWGLPLPECYVRSISQEHGVVKLSKEVFDQLTIGDVLGVLPVHSCMTADAMGEYNLLSGDKIDHFKGQIRQLK